MTNTTKTLAEMRAFVKETFGDEATLEYTDSGWVINTHWEEKVDVDAFAGTAAEVAYNEDEATYGSTLDRWMVKNGHYGSVNLAAEAYNAMVHQHWKEAWRTVTTAIADGRAETFDWEGWPEYREQVLSIGEKYGWTMENTAPKRW